MKMLTEEKLRAMMLEVWEHGQKSGVDRTYAAHYSHEGEDAQNKKNVADRDQLLAKLVDEA